MPVGKKSFYAYVRRTAYDLWAGPDFVENREKENEDNPLGGYFVLRLAIRKGETAKPMIESRAVYAMLTPDTSYDALLRAIYWDNKDIIHKTRSNTPIDTPFKIAAKFVQMPLSLLHQWIRLLENIPTIIQTIESEDDSLPICSLRVTTTNAVSSLFEKTWQVVEGENVELNHVWQEVWAQMGQALKTAPNVPDVEESFYHTEKQADIYDFQAYQPTLTLP